MLLEWCSAYKDRAHNKFVLPIFKQIDSAILSAASVNQNRDLPV